MGMYVSFCVCLYVFCLLKINMKRFCDDDTQPWWKELQQFYANQLWFDFVFLLSIKLEFHGGGFCCRDVSKALGFLGWVWNCYSMLFCMLYTTSSTCTYSNLVSQALVPSVRSAVSGQVRLSFSFVYIVLVTIRFHQNKKNKSGHYKSFTIFFFWISAS